MTLRIKMPEWEGDALGWQSARAGDYSLHTRSQNRSGRNHWSLYLDAPCEGGLDPIEEGHTTTMEKAKQAAEQAYREHVMSHLEES